MSLDPRYSGAALLGRKGGGKPQRIRTNSCSPSCAHGRRGLLRTFWPNRTVVVGRLGVARKLRRLGATDRGGPRLMPTLKGLVFGEFDHHGKVADATWHRKPASSRPLLTPLT